MICEADCAAKLESTQLVTLPSGLQYKEIVVGRGPKPPVGFQVRPAAAAAKERLLGLGSAAPSPAHTRTTRTQHTPTWRAQRPAPRSPRSPRSPMSTRAGGGQLRGDGGGQEERQAARVRQQPGEGRALRHQVRQPARLPGLGWLAGCKRQGSWLRLCRAAGPGRRRPRRPQPSTRTPPPSPPTTPYPCRVGAGQVIPGLDEALQSMQPGGIRRLYVPGALAFPKNLKAAPGRPAIPAFTPVIFDVQLLYIPGLEADDE
jgi:hypothetical protein